MLTKLDSNPVRVWDESRLAVNTYEMIQSGNYIVPTFEHQPDMWNLKPPFMLWMQIICIKAVGIGELAFRLPSAIAGILCCLLVFGMVKKVTRTAEIGFMAAIVLASTPGYVDYHLTRSGDYDSLLIFLNFLGLYFFYIYTENQKNIFYYLFFLILGVAVLTKSIVGLMFLPGILLYSIYSNMFIVLAKNKHTYIGLGLFFLIAGSYYITREHLNPGYLAAVQENEVGGRFNNTIESHSGSFLFYIKLLLQEQITPWYLMALAGLVLGIFSPEKTIQKSTMFISLVFVTFLLTISLAQTKLTWYSGPLYPLVAFLTGIFLYHLLQFFKSNTFIGSYIKEPILYCTVFIILLLTPYKDITIKSFNHEEHPWGKDDYHTSFVLQQALKNKIDISNTKIVYDNYKAHLLIYVDILNDRNQNISFANINDLKSGDKVLIEEGDPYEKLKKAYSFQYLYQWNKTILLEIL
ncbi:MAG: glycosyltransferase family 39 protein [Cytophagaceae bacterium]